MSESGEETKKSRKPRTINHGERVRKAWEAFKAVVSEAAGQEAATVEISIKDAESGQIVVGKVDDCLVAITASF